MQRAGAGLAYAATKLVKILSSKPTDEETATKDKLKAAEQEKRYAAAADEYWQYQLYMANR